jgi:ribosome recycling factor
MTMQEVNRDARERMEKSAAALRADLAKVRAGRAHPGMLDHVMVPCHGVSMALGKVASVSALDARGLGVKPWDRSLLAAIEKAIGNAGLGLSPATQGDMVRVPVPPLSAERRVELAKLVKRLAEGARVALRNIRRDANESLGKLAKKKGCSEDEARAAADEVGKMTERFIAEIDKAAMEKESEVSAA